MSTSAKRPACTPIVELYYGHFLRHRIYMELANPPPPGVEVGKNEEKRSDVILALHVFNDAWQNAYDGAVIVSNDSDLAESLRLVKAQNPKVIGLVTRSGKWSPQCEDCARCARPAAA